MAPLSPSPPQILITERFDEGLMVLRNLLRWHLVDMTYTSVNKTAGREGRMGVLKDRSPFEKLPKDVREARPCTYAVACVGLLGTCVVATGLLAWPATAATEAEAAVCVRVLMSAFDEFRLRE